MGGSKRGRPQPRGSPLPSASFASHPRLLSLTLSPRSQVKRIVTHLLCVCLNKIYIVLSFLFSFFHVSSLILHIEAPWRGPASPFPPAGWNVGLLLGQEAGGEGVAAEPGDRPRGSGGLQAQLAQAGSLVGLWSCVGVTPLPATPPATSTRQTTSGARPRTLGQGSCLSWAHLPLSTLPLPPPTPLPSPPGLEEPGGQRSEEARRSNFQAVLLP